MAFSDLFGTSFLFSIAIILPFILIGALYTYMNYKISEQDHKLSSMVNLVSILAQEVQHVKQTNYSENTNTKTEPKEFNLEYASQLVGGTDSVDLISVSDEGNEDDVSSDEEYSDYEGDDDDDEGDDDDDEGDDDDEDGEDEDGEDEDGEDEDVEDNMEEHIKILNLSLANEPVDRDYVIEELTCDDEPLMDNHSFEEIKTIHLEEPIVFEETELHEEPNLDLNITDGSISFLKNVNMSDLGENDELHTVKTDYKRMSLNKLREVVVSKGVVSDATKLKKHELLKILGDDAI
jgi:hypothetical protein